MCFLLAMSLFLQINSQVGDPGEAETPMTETNPYEKPCWKAIYQHDQNGERIDGERDVLMQLVKAGRPIKVAIINDYFTQVITCDAVTLDEVGDLVLCQKANLVGLNGFVGARFGLHAAIKRKYLMVDSMGGMQAMFWYVDPGRPPLTETDRTRIQWYACVE